MRPQIVLFGDSITQQSFALGGWGASLADTFSRKADIVNLGYSRYNTRWALFSLNYLFPLDAAKQPVAVTIFFGANDAALVGRRGEAKQHVPVEEYKENLKKIVDHLKKCSPTVLIVLVTPPPVDEEGRKHYARAAGKDKRNGWNPCKCMELAKEHCLPCINLWSKMQESEGWQKRFLSDGLHLTPKGNAVVSEEVIKAFKELQLSAELIPYDFPPHSDIDHKNPESAFPPQCFQ